jgi:hypothetical protein
VIPPRREDKNSLDTISALDIIRLAVSFLSFKMVLVVPGR